ncbi:MAG: class I SAM-dependent methyltransferase [Thermaurantiacus sp.]
MTRYVTHDLALAPSPGEAAAQDFVSTLRAHVLNDMAASMKARYEQAVAPGLPAGATGPDVLEAMRPEPYFRFYSAARVKAQEMVWASVRATVDRQGEELSARAATLAADRARALGTLSLNPGLAIPANVSDIDVHLMPGSYVHEDGEQDLAAGALYENGLSVFSFGLMGETLDDIGRSITLWLAARFPDFRPADILDLGCSVGHQTLPWARTFPDARVTGLDVSAPCLRYAHARAQSLGLTAHFLQADATAVPLPDASQDLVFSSMFLHELPVADIRAVIGEAHRLLRPGGLMLHYELPPNEMLTAYDGFYLDWDSHFNAEPFYKGYRDLVPREEAGAAGFASENFLEAAIPSLGFHGEDAVRAAAREGGAIGSDTLGRLADGIRWYVWGAWK